MDISELFEINGIIYKVDLFNEHSYSTSLCSIENILTEGVVDIPETISVPDSLKRFYPNKDFLYVTGITINCLNNIIDKNITYFNVINTKNITNYIKSYDGIIYLTENEENDSNIYKLSKIIAIPPKLNIKEYHIPKTVMSVNINLFNINPYIERIYILNKYTNFYSINNKLIFKYVKEIVYKNHIIKCNKNLCNIYK